LKKTIVILIAAILFGSVFLFVPTGQSENIETPFGEIRVEIDGVTSTGQIVPFTTVKTVAGQLFSWSSSGQEIDHLNIKIYASATGDGYEICELVFHDFALLASLENSDDWGEPMYPLQSDFELPVNGNEVMIMDALFDVSELDDSPGLETGDTFAVDFFFGPDLPFGDMKYRGIEADGTESPWQSYTVTLSLTTEFTITYDDDYTPPPPTCNEPFPGQNCQSNPSICGPCNAHLTTVTTNPQQYIAAFGWSSSSSYGECDIIYKYYDVDHWSPWEAANTNDHIEVFRYRNVFAVTARPTEEAVFYAQAYMIHEDGELAVALQEYHIYDNDRLGQVCQPGEWGNAYFHTDKKENHLLTKGEGWSIGVAVWFVPTSGGNEPTTYHSIYCHANSAFTVIYYEVENSQGGSDKIYDQTATFSNIPSGDTLISCKYMYNGNEHTDGHSRNLQSDITEYFDISGGPLSFVSNNIFLIQVEQYETEKYQYGEKYLGRL